MEHVKNLNVIKDNGFNVNFSATKDNSEPVMSKMKPDAVKTENMYPEATSNIDDEKLYMTFQLNNMPYDQCYSMSNPELNHNAVKNEEQEVDDPDKESDTMTEKPYKCTDCDYKTKRANCLINHTRVHSGIRPYGCPFCSYRASLKDHLTRHIRTHTGDKPYRCPHCTYTSAHSSALKRHIRNHTGDRPYSCPHCSYRSIQRSAITKHITRHTGLRPFSCPHCDYKAAHNETLKRHLKIHGHDTIKHREHNCPYCNYTTTQAKSFQSHIMKHKSEDPHFNENIKELWK